MTLSYLLQFLFFFSLSLCVFVQLGSSNYVCMCVFCQRRHARVKRLMDKPQSKLLLRLSSPFSTFHSLLSINRFVVKKILVCFPFAFKQRFAYSSEHLDDDHSVEEKVEDLMYLAMPAVTCGNTPWTVKLTAVTCCTQQQGRVKLVTLQRSWSNNNSLRLPPLTLLTQCNI